MDAAGAPSLLSTKKTAAPDTVLLSRELIAAALDSSNDQGQTLDLSHRDLTEVTDANAIELANAAVDPDDGDSSVLRVALGYNRLTALPPRFDTLKRLRYLNLRSNLFSTFPAVLTDMPSLEVLDISRNRIRRLPNDPGSLKNLRVFSITRNRFTKLPHYLTGFNHLTVLKVSHNPIQWPEGMRDEPDDPDDSGAMKRWISALKAWLEDTVSGIPPTRIQENGDQSTYDIVKSDYEVVPVEIDLSSDEPADTFQPDTLVTMTPHARSFSIDSVSTNASQMSETSDTASPTDVDESSTFSPPSSPSRTPDVSLFIPDDSPMFDSPHASSQQHARNASYSVSGPSRQLGSTLMANKSLPDLRTGFGESSAHRKARRPPRLPDLPTASATTSQNGSPAPGIYSPGFPTSNGTRTRSATHGAVLSSNNIAQAADSHTSSVDPDRNAYFRRFSVQRPPAGKQPEHNASLLAIIDAARGIFFALSQVYEALRQFTVSVINDGLSSVLLKVLHPARKFLSQLIDALDRFDEQSKQPNPSPIVSRNVIQACKDSVSVFGKVVGVLNMQLSLVTASHDPRYTRWLLLILHGSIAEVSVSWQIISDHGDAIHSILKSARSIPKSHSTSRSMASPVAKPGESPTPLTNSSEWSHRSRRHAGSFSFKDLQIGRALPSTDAPPGTPPPLRRPGHVNGTPTPSAHAFAASKAPTEPQHSRDGSYSFTATNDLGSPNGQSTPHASPTPTHNVHHVAATAVDQDLFATMDATIETASGVWSHLSELLQDSSDPSSSLSMALQIAHDVTRKLRDDLENIQTSSTNALRKAIWDHANTFLKAVVQVITEVKGLSEGQQVVPAGVRKAIARLTQLTQELAMLLQVSSFAPSPTAPPEGTRSPSISTLGRSRSAHASTSEKQTPRPKDMPMSAQPQQQAFKIPPSPFVRV